MSSLAEKLSEIVGRAFVKEGLPAELGAVRVSDRTDLAQFQCNGAMAAAKIAGKKPREIAERILSFLSPVAVLKNLEIAGPGFINLNVTDEFISSHLAEISQNGKVGIEEVSGATVVLDYGAPNIAKPMHVGHLRSSIIGESLWRIMSYAGYNAIGDVHLGDWGLPMGQVISELQIMHPDWPYFDQAYNGAYPAQSPVTIDELEKIYPAASNACKIDPARMEKARAATRELQDGRRGYRALWKHFVDVSIEGMKNNFDALGVHFDLWKSEASVHGRIAPMVERLKKKGIAVENDGAVVVALAQADDKKEMPPLILYKSDGAVMYGTTDLATIEERVEENRPAKIIYVVDQRQSLHFEQVFRAARKGDIAPEGVELIHAGFGTMNGPDGKPFKTRAGGVMRLEDLITMAIEKAQARLKESNIAQDFSETERGDIAHKVAIAAIKFADLHNNRTADYMFDLDRMTSFEGKTGPYLLYQAVRIKSLLRKADEGMKGSGDDAKEISLISSPPHLLIRDEDRPLALVLAEFPDHFNGALKNLAPHILCDYAFRLAQAFSAFYGACHILSEKDASLRHSRLALCKMTQARLEICLGLLGIEIPDRM